MEEGWLVRGLCCRSGWLVVLVPGRSVPARLFQRRNSCSSAPDEQRVDPKRCYFQLRDPTNPGTSHTVTFTLLELGDLSA